MGGMRTLLIAALLVTPLLAFAETSRRIPVILDTDLGDDIDDAWALVLALRSPEIDLKMVVTDNRNATYRARIAAKLLTLAGRTDVPIGLGVGDSDKPGRQSGWIKEVDLKAYPGKVHRDGVAAMIELIMSSPQPITLVCIGPVQNIAEALKREPRIAGKARFVGMHGSVRIGYNGSAKPSAEWNVKVDAQACGKALSAPWEVTITPLDTCDRIRLTGEKYAKVRDCKDPLIAGLIESYRDWARVDKHVDPSKASSTLFDTVAVYLAMSTELLEMEKLPIRVTPEAMTVIDEKEGKVMNVATKWKDMAAFEDWLVGRLVK